MKCAIKFCGGCNPHYDRVGAYNRIVSELPDIDFAYAEEDETYDKLLVIGGCTACCPAFDQYAVTGDVLKMWSEEQVGSIIDRINAK